MVKRIFILLLLAWFSYSFLVYAYSTKESLKPGKEVQAGFSLWQKSNCQACHQLYGLGGYMGPDLTNIISDSSKGAVFATAYIRAGSPKMPNFNFSENEISGIVAFLSWVDKSGRSIVSKNNVTTLGNYNLDNR